MHNLHNYQKVEKNKREEFDCDRNVKTTLTNDYNKFHYRIILVDSDFSEYDMRYHNNSYR